jgi:hypothetical protein
MRSFLLACLLVCFVGSTVQAVDLRATWNDNADNEDGYRLEVCSGDCRKGGTWTLYAISPANSVTLFPVTVTVFPLSFRLFAFNFVGDSAPSNIVVLDKPSGSSLSFQIGP